MSVIYDRCHRFFTDADDELFFKIFPKAIYSYLLFWVWSLDWSFYLAFPWNYKKLGVFNYIGLPPLTEIGLFITQLVCSVTILLALFRPKKTFSSVLIFVSIFLLDAWHNLYGFIDARIHIVWMCGLMSFYYLSIEYLESELSGKASSVIYRCLELILVSVYFQSGIAKLLKGGLEWMTEGTTTQFGILRQGLPIGEYIAQYQDIMIALSVLGLLMELAFAFYFALGKNRYILLVVALCFHLGTYILLGINFIHLYLLTACLLLGQVFPRIRRSQIEDNKQFV